MSTDLRPRKTVLLHLGEDAERLEELRAAFERAVQAETLQQRGNSRVADAPRDTTVADAAAAYDAYLVESNERGVPVPLVSLGRKPWRELVKAHPVRTEVINNPDGTTRIEKNPDDEQWGFDVDSLADDLVPASLEEHAQKSDDFLDNLTDGQWSRLYYEARGLNTGMGIDPKVSLSSRIAPISDATSALPERLG